jgi:hypothetical protein
MTSSTILFIVGVTLVLSGLSMAAFPSLYNRACAVWDLLRDFHSATGDDTGHDYSDAPTVVCSVHECRKTIKAGNPAKTSHGYCDDCLRVANQDMTEYFEGRGE